MYVEMLHFLKKKYDCCDFSQPQEYSKKEKKNSYCPNLASL